MEFKIKEGPITMLSVGVTYEGKFKFVIAEGQSVHGPIPPTGNTNTRGFFEPDVRTFLKRWVAEGPTHHFCSGCGTSWGDAGENCGDPGYRGGCGDTAWWTADHVASLWFCWRLNAFLKRLIFAPYVLGAEKLGRRARVYALWPVVVRVLCQVVSWGPSSEGWCTKSGVGCQRLGFRSWATRWRFCRYRVLAEGEASSTEGVFERIEVLSRDLGRWAETHIQ